MTLTQPSVHVWQAAGETPWYQFLIQWQEGGGEGKQGCLPTKRQSDLAALSCSRRTPYLPHVKPQLWKEA